MAERTRCPECGAMLTTGAEWCPQCYASLRRPAPEAPAAPAAEPHDVPPEAVTGEAVPAGEAVPERAARHRSPDAGQRDPGWPCPRCGTVNDLAADVCIGCGSGFLAPLAEDRGIPEVPGFSSLSRSGRLGATLLALVVLLAVLAGAVWLVS